MEKPDRNDGQKVIHVTRHLPLLLMRAVEPDVIPPILEQQGDPLSLRDRP